MNGEKVIAIAKREIGVTEVPFNTNKTKYGQCVGSVAIRLTSTM